MPRILLTFLLQCSEEDARRWLCSGLAGRVKLASEGEK